jgi:hypothetical protein
MTPNYCVHSEDPSLQSSKPEVAGYNGSHAEIFNISFGIPNARKQSPRDQRIEEKNGVRF